MYYSFLCCYFFLLHSLFLLIFSISLLFLLLLFFSKFTFSLVYFLSFHPFFLRHLFTSLYALLVPYRKATALAHRRGRLPASRQHGRRSVLLVVPVLQEVCRVCCCQLVGNKLGTNIPTCQSAPISSRCGVKLHCTARQTEGHPELWGCTAPHKFKTRKSRHTFASSSRFE